ncbi:HWE histidine kinase domain-containing protein [Bradyrhizobium sp. LTSP857]|uniref:sensor histidine kinase n=1 Tax=Bradyrhizobium sp. LTSP857 TaxID=1619231 RepID=UPI000679ADE8|nr:HWE histidine kinase domain-containing protein [Bradyrhizobium sp. LTSP857]
MLLSGAQVGLREELPQSLAGVFITAELGRRTTTPRNHLREKLAIQDIADRMSDQPTQILPQLVKLAMEISGAESAGISILEQDKELFRWFGLAGVLAAFEGATTPRNDSPCGVCLDFDGPILMDRPERVYAWIADANITVPEVLLVPLRVKGSGAIGTLWLVAKEPGYFDLGHVQATTELAAFAGVALRMIQTEERLNQSLHAQEVLTREMSHRVKNLFALTASMIRMSNRTSSSQAELADKLTGRVLALADANALVRRQFGAGAPDGVGLEELIVRILRPHEHMRSIVRGPALPVGERATNNIALVFHELATNAAKYGALSSEGGTVRVTWTIADQDVHLVWQESGGPLASPPASQGYGARLVSATVSGLSGKLDYDWAPQGLKAEMRFPLASLQA